MSINSQDLGPYLDLVGLTRFITPYEATIAGG